MQKQCSRLLNSMSYLGVKGYMTFFPFRSVTFEALEGFWRNLTQMFTRLRRCAEAIFRMAGFKVKVILRGQWPYDFFPFRSVTLEPLKGFRRNLTQMITTLRRRAEAMFGLARIKVILRKTWHNVNQTKFCSHFLIQPFGRILPRFAVFLFICYEKYSVLWM